jgi:hypothetical protein
LTEPYPEFEGITGKFWTPECLLAELSNRGIHLLPDDFDYIEAKIPRKTSETEKNAIRDIAYAIESFYVRS